MENLMNMIFCLFHSWVDFLVCYTASTDSEVLEFPTEKWHLLNIFKWLQQLWVIVQIMVVFMDKVQSFFSQNNKKLLEQYKGKI